MLTAEYDDYRRRATQDEGVGQGHRELATANRSRCQALCEEPPAAHSATAARRRTDSY